MRWNTNRILNHWISSSNAKAELTNVLTDLQGGLGGVGDSFYPGDRRSLHKVSPVNELTKAELIGEHHA
jgi:hypothetical protein